MHHATDSSIRDSDVTDGDVSQFHGHATSTKKLMAHVQFLHNDPVAWNSANLCNLHSALADFPRRSHGCVFRADDLRG
jgi:hypothetical protein